MMINDVNLRRKLREQAAPGASSAADAYEEKVRRKLREQMAPGVTAVVKPATKAAPAAPGISNVTNATLDNYNAKMKRKMEMTSSGEKNAPSPASISATSETSNDKYNERLKKKMAESSVPSARSTLLAKERYEERLRKKMEEAGRAPTWSPSPPSSSSPCATAAGVEDADLERSLSLDEKIATKKKKKKEREKEKNMAKSEASDDDRAAKKKEKKKKSREKKEERLRQRPKRSLTKDEVITDLRNYKTLQVAGTQPQPDDMHRTKLRQSMRSGFVRTKSTRLMAGLPADALDNAKSSVKRDETRTASLLRSLSSDNLCPGSWECRVCTFVNEPVGIASQVECRMCGELNEDNDDYNPKLKEPLPNDGASQASLNINRRELFNRSKSTMSVINLSWSQLGDALDVAKNKSIESVLEPEYFGGKIMSDSFNIKEENSEVDWRGEAPDPARPRKQQQLSWSNLDSVLDAAMYESILGANDHLSSGEEDM